MGPGQDAFSLFGHAALCVFDQRSPDGRCYNYGTTDFSRPVSLSLHFLRGKARFWVSVSSESSMVDAYAASGRAVYRQWLPLPPHRARAFALALERDLEPDRRSYQYHHFDDNCATRLRDSIDSFTGGRLRTGAVHDESMREIVRRGLGASPLLVAISELVLGRRVDALPSRWQAMFLPDVLRDEVTKQLGAKPEVVSPQRVQVRHYDPRVGRFWIAWVGAVLGAVFAALHASRRRWVSRTGLVLSAAVFGGVGLVLASIAAVSSLSDLRENEVLFVLTPLDLMVAFLRGSWLKWFVWIRIAGLVGVVLCMVLGVFVQPLSAPVFALAVWLIGLAAARPSHDRHGEPVSGSAWC